MLQKDTPLVVGMHRSILPVRLFKSSPTARNLIRFLVLLFLGLLLALGFGIPGSVRRPKLPQEIAASLKSNPAITLYSLQPRGGPDIPEWDFHRHHILGHLDLNKEQAQTAIRALKEALSEGNADQISGCIINPRHALRCRADGHTFDILICYQCGQLEFYKDDRSLPFQGTIGRKPGTLNDLLKAANIPLADVPPALEKSYAEEAKVALKRAEKGDPKAQEVVAKMLMKGRGVETDEAEGIKWLAKSQGASPDSPKFQIELGRMYREGQDVTENYSAALDLFRKAAAQGNAEAVYQIGQLYEFGEGVTRNTDEAMKFFRQAAELGHAKAQFEIGVRHAQGRDLNQDYVEALKWLRQAAEQNHPEALTWMGNMYEKGWGVPKDLTEAHYWNRLAAEYRSVYSSQVSASFSSNQLTAIEKRVTEWKAVHPKRPAGR